ncbi:hypothetical protein KY340_03590 [Candidatus Woesearchaeota archaeon]|nr:hypothetical protein [Candidatus Woesearchaeota archaeon]
MAEATSVSFEPHTFYEANTINFTVDVNNLFSSKIINEVELTMPEFTIVAVEQFAGWTENHTAVHVEWRGGTIEGNVRSALFMFNATVPVIDSDRSKNISIDTRFTDGNDITFVIPINIINDVTGPVISNTIPADGGYLRANNPNQLVHANVNDPETGIGSANFKWNACSNSSNNQINLACNGNDCNGTIDVSSFDEGEQICFTFTVVNKGGESSQVSGTAGFDGTAPTVSLVSPANNAYLGTSGQFSFTASDNVAPIMSCDLLIDEDIVQTINANDSQTTLISADLSGFSEGAHLWKMRCRDTVGLQGESGARTFVLDNTPPNLELISPVNQSTISDSTVFNINATDNYGVAQISSNPNINNISNWPEGPNNVVLQVIDHVGNMVRKGYLFFVDRTAPSISLISPANGANVDTHVQFIFNISDNYATDINCTIYVDGTKDASSIVNPGTATISSQLSLGNHTWYARCKDEVGNNADSAQRAITVVDTSGPDIVLTDIITVERGTDFVIEATVTDVSGVDTVVGLIGQMGSTFNLNKNGDVYTKTVGTNSDSVLGNYTYTVTATDSNGYSSTAQDTFELVPYTGNTGGDSGSGSSGGSGSNSGFGFKQSTAQQSPTTYSGQDSNAGGQNQDETEEEPGTEEEPPVQTKLDEKTTLPETKGVGKATSIFSSSLFKFAGLFVLIVIILSLFALGYTKIPKLRFKKSEEEIARTETEKEAFFNEKLKKDLNSDLSEIDAGEEENQKFDQNNFLFDNEGD